jgi:hypothetical protein
MANELDTVRELIEQTTRGMSEEQLCFHPAEKWSAANILEHLLLAFSGTVKGLERVLEAGKPLGGRRSPRDVIFQTTLLTFGYFPSGRKAPKMVVPTCTLGGLQAIEKIQAQLATMARKLAEAEELLGNECAILDHPILGPMRVPQWRQFHLTHTRHHMKQIHRLRAMQSQATVAARA